MSDNSILNPNTLLLILLCDKETLHVHMKGPASSKQEAGALHRNKHTHTILYLYMSDKIIPRYAITSQRVSTAVPEMNTESHW